MIKPYRNIPRFDNGWDYNAALLNALNYGAPTLTVAPTPGYEFLEPPVYQYERDEPEIPDMEEPAFMRMTADDVLGKPKLKRVTTAVQDRRAALKAYTNAVRAADKKAAAENKTAKAEIKKNEAVLRRNGQPTYDRAAAIKRLNDIRARSEYWKQRQAVRKPKLTKETGKYGTVYSAYGNSLAGAVGIKKTKPKVDTRGGYTSIGGAAWRPGKQASSSNRGHELIRALAAFFTSTPNGKTHRKPTNSINGINYGRSLLK